MEKMRKPKRKEIECLGGKSGTLLVEEDLEDGRLWLYVSNRESDTNPRLARVKMTQREAMRLYDFLGKVLA